jgi:hypothetical protein
MINLDTKFNYAISNNNLKSGKDIFKTSDTNTVAKAQSSDINPPAKPIPKTKTPAKATDVISTPKKTISFNDGQNLTLGLSLDTFPNSKFLNRTTEVADKTINNFQAAYGNNTTYKFDDQQNLANEINLGVASKSIASNTNIILGENDTIKGLPFAQAFRKDAEDGKNVIITLVDKGPKQDSKFPSTVQITVPINSLESATKQLTAEQKQDLGIKEASEATRTTSLEPDFIADEEGSDENPYDKNQD